MKKNVGWLMLNYMVLEISCLLVIVTVFTSYSRQISLSSHNAAMPKSVNPTIAGNNNNGSYPSTEMFLIGTPSDGSPVSGAPSGASTELAVSMKDEINAEHAAIFLPIQMKIYEYLGCIRNILSHRWGRYRYNTFR
jgi:hypothetical protein